MGQRWHLPLPYDSICKASGAGPPEPLASQLFPLPPRPSQVPLLTAALVEREGARAQRTGRGKAQPEAGWAGGEQATWGLAFQLFLQMSRPKCTEVKRQLRPHTPGAGRWPGGRGCDSRAPSSAPAWPSFPAHQGEQSVVLNPGTAEGAGSVRPQGVELRAGVVLKPPWPQVPRPQSCLYSHSTGRAQAGVAPRPADLCVSVCARVRVCTCEVYSISLHTQGPWSAR